MTARFDQPQPADLYAALILIAATAVITWAWYTRHQVWS